MTLHSLQLQTGKSSCLMLALNYLLLYYIISSIYLSHSNIPEQDTIAPFSGLMFKKNYSNFKANEETNKQ